MAAKLAVATRNRCARLVVVAGRTHTDAASSSRGCLVVFGVVGAHAELLAPARCPPRSRPCSPPRHWGPSEAAARAGRTRRNACREARSRSRPRGRRAVRMVYIN